MVTSIISNAKVVVLPFMVNGALIRNGESLMVKPEPVILALSELIKVTNGSVFVSVPKNFTVLPGVPLSVLCVKLSTIPANAEGAASIKQEREIHRIFILT